MPVDRTLLIAVFAGAAIAGTYASCANSCSGHGTCGSHDRCTCYPMYEGTDCSLKSCPSGPSFVDGSNAADVHGYSVCSGRGTCDHEFGECKCADGYTGYNCGRSVCPNDCSGHGKCSFAKDISSANYADYDAGMTRSCICDGYYSGADCSFRQCPRGDDPLTTEIECQGVASGLQAHEVQEITINADTMLSGEMTLTYTDAYGQAWTTAPIGVGGDNKFDLRLTSAHNGKCSFRYIDAVDSPSQYADGTATSTDFSGRLHMSPSTASASLESALCNAATAAELDAIISHNSAVRNVHVVKSADVSDGAKFEITVGGFNGQNANTAGEIGAFSFKENGNSGTSGTIHSLGDHSGDIARALTSLPYNVIPSVTVTKQASRSSDYASADVAKGNGIQQKYRVTFSDAANAGDQNLLQCNAEPCDEDGCAPRSAGVSHEKIISSTNHFDDKIADYKTAIVATGQGGFWLRSYKSNRYTVNTWTSGTYYMHRDLGNGKTSSATFQYNDDAAAIQSALQTIEGWSGISVSCNSGADSYAKGKGVPAKAGHSSTEHGLECYVTYPVGYDDGARLPTMTYDNFNGGDTASTNTLFHCVNEICTATPGALASAADNFGRGAGAATSDDVPIYENNNGYVYIKATSGHVQSCTMVSTFNSVAGQTVTQATSGAVGTIGVAANSQTQKIIISNGIDFDNTGIITVNGVADGGLPTCAAAQHALFKTGTYEIVRTTTSAAITNFIFYAPGQPNCASYTTCIDPASISNDFAKVYATTPLMPMWPDISNSIALHDTTMRVIFDAGFATSEAFTSGHANMVLATWNIGYGSLGYTATMKFHGHTRCEDIQAELIKFKPGGVTGFSTTNTPYPSLLDPNDSTRSICDCRKMDAMSTGLTGNIMWDITCPAFIANHLWITGARGIAAGSTNARAVAKVTTGAERAYTTYTYIRQTPPSGIETKVAVGDKITVTSSNSNNNKQYTVKSFVDDGKWGSGKKNIWSTAAGYLGADHANGVVSANSVILSATMDYRAYGDFVKFAKVEPVPTTDYQITEMKAVGQNSTSFTRTLESISTTDTSIATLTFYDGIDSGDANIAALTGTFQLTYNGEDTAIMQALVSASDMMEALSGLSTVDIAPTVTRSAASTGLPSISWTITFNSKMGDAKKLTFKYTDTIGTERQESAIVDSGSSNTLANTVTVKSEGSDYSTQVKRDIVMQYTQEGSTFFDSFSTTASTVHDELSADVTVGTTLNVKASEEIYYYIFDEGATAKAGATDASDICGNTAQPYITYEFNGQVSLPTVVCASSTAITTDSNMNTQLNALTGLATASCAWTGSDIVDRSGTPDTTFNQHFPWGATHVGVARLLLKCTLPLGVDGSSFKIHAHLHSDGGWRLGNANNAGQAYQYRARNNNGRSFTVTQAYENKISDMTHFSRVPAVSTDGTVLGSTYGIVPIGNVIADAAVTAAVTAGTIRYNPGTYYNVKLWTNAGSNKDAFAKVVVGIDGVKEVEIVYGSYLANIALSAEMKYLIKCDTRINSGLTCTGAGVPATNMIITVEAGDLTSHAKFNVLTASLIVGASSAQVSGTLGGACSAQLATNTIRRHVNSDCKTGSSGGTLHTNNVLMECTCTSGTDLTSCKIVGGGAGTSAPPVDIATLQGGNVFCHATGNVAAAMNADSAAEFAPASINSFYHVAGFYDTGTPKYFVDALHEGALDATALLNSQSLAIMGARSGTSNYPYRSYVGVNERQLYNDLQSFGPQQAGSGRKLASISPTSSVVAGTQGTSITFGPGAFYVEHAEKYQYAGRGFDQLTVTPQPDKMTDQKIVITYRGAAGSCSVKEVDRGTHESAVCSGRGNCDHATGTCVCDAGYTLEACSEQTVLV